MNRIALTVLAILVSCIAAGETLCDHEVVLDAQGRLQPWTSYDRILRGSMDYIEHCPTHRTALGDDPWYLVTSKLHEDGSFRTNQNNQGSNAYYAVETLTRYYAYSGDRDAFKPVRLLLDRVMKYHTPGDWAWPRVPRTQDDTPDGQYTDETSEPDKMAMVGYAYLRFHASTGERKYLAAARGIAKTLAAHVVEGDAEHSPLPFRVNLKTGEVLDAYTSDMVFPVMFFDAMAAEEGGEPRYASIADALWRWICAYPLLNQRWSGYYEDVKSNPNNFNQQIPIETARYMMRHPERDADFKTHVPALIAWVRERFGKTQRFGATSICEQDCCFKEMSSHTSRYASVVALWYGVTGDVAVREEARASFALTSYSTFSKYSKGERALNYVGIGYIDPWFSDSYFDFLPHLMDGMAEMPDMAPTDADHILGSNDIVTSVTYSPNHIEYTTASSSGEEILRLTFTPKVLAEGRPMDSSAWTFGEYHGASNVLRIHRAHERHIVVKAAQ